MRKRILSVLAGVGTGLAIVVITDEIAGKLYPHPSNIDFKNMEAVKAMVSSMPMGAFLTMLGGYIVAAFAGGLVATLVSGRENPRSAILTGGVLMVGGVMNVLAVPGHPIWFIASGVVCNILFSYLGFLIVRKKA